MVKEIFLKPAGMYFGEGPSRVKTILGSCVSITMFHAGSQFGAICHAVLPFSKEAVGEPEPYKYVDTSIVCMLREFNVRGIVRDEIQVKLFGGAHMFAEENLRRKHMTVGSKNLETAIKMLETEGLRLQSYNIGGLYGRKIHFYTHTGEVFIKQQKNSLLNQAAGENRQKAAICLLQEQRLQAIRNNVLLKNIQKDAGI